VPNVSVSSDGEWGKGGLHSQCLAGARNVCAHHQDLVGSMATPLVSAASAIAAGVAASAADVDLNPMFSTSSGIIRLRLKSGNVVELDADTQRIMTIATLREIANTPRVDDQASLDAYVATYRQKLENFTRVQLDKTRQALSRGNSLRDSAGAAALTTVLGATLGATSAGVVPALLLLGFGATRAHGYISRKIASVRQSAAERLANLARKVAPSAGALAGGKFRAATPLLRARLAAASRQHRAPAARRRPRAE
jgi:hypothetical protein